MYKILFVIIFASVMWMGLAKVENLIAAHVKAQVEETTPTIGLGSVLQLVQAGNIAIVDMRELSDYDRSHIKDAVSVHQIDSAGMKERLNDRLKKARNVVLYSIGGVSDQMRRYAETLSKQGIRGVAFYSGGFSEWTGAGLPVEKGN